MGNYPLMVLYTGTVIIYSNTSLTTETLGA